MAKREYLFYLEDMILSIEKISNYLQNVSFEEFIKNDMVIDAVIRNFEIIGEAANNVPDEIQYKYSNVPWSKMYRLRNIVVHNYHGIDYEMIWEIAQNHLPKNKLDLQIAFDNENKNSNQLS